MAVEVIHLLETVEIANNDRVGLAAANRVGVRGFNLFLKGYAIAGASEQIDAAQRFQPLVVFHELAVQLPQFPLQGHDALGDDQSGPELVGIEGLADEVVRTGR